MPFHLKIDNDTPFRVRDDIIESLGLDKDRLFMALHQFNRPNLFYEV